MWCSHAQLHDSNDGSERAIGPVSFCTSRSDCGRVCGGSGARTGSDRCCTNEICLSARENAPCQRTADACHHSGRRRVCLGHRRPQNTAVSALSRLSEQHASPPPSQVLHKGIHVKTKETQIFFFKKKKKKKIFFPSQHEKIRQDELEEFEISMTKTCRELQDMEEMYQARGEGNGIPCFTVIYVISDIQSNLQGFDLCPSIYAQLLQKKPYLDMARAIMKVMKKSSHHRMIALFDEMLVVMNLEQFQTFFAGEKRCAFCTCAGSLNKCAACNVTFYCKGGKEEGE